MAKAENKTKSAAVRKAERHEYKSQKNWQPLTSPEKLKAHQQKMAEKRKKAEAPPKPKQAVEVKRHLDGKYMKGECPNPLGRPADGTTQLDHLLAAIRRVESKRNLKLLDHFCDRAFDSDKILIAVFKKIIPDLAAVQITPGFNEQMSDDAALHIQNILRERYGEFIAQEESETPPLLESESENPT